MRDVWLRVNKGKHMAISCVHIHPYITCSLGKHCKRDWVCLFIVCPRFSWAVLGLMSTSGNVQEKHWAIGPGFCSAAVHFFSLCSRNGCRQWLDVTDFCFFVRLFAFLHFEFQRRAWDKDENLTTTREEPLNATEGGLSLGSPFTVFSPSKEKPYLIWFDNSNFCSKKRKGDVVWVFFQAWNIHSASSGLISKKMSAVLFAFVCLFVCSFFYLPYCSYKTYRWVDECIVLLLLTCLRLYGFAVSVVFFLLGDGGTGGREESLV